MTKARTLAAPSAVLGIVSVGVAVLVLLSSIPLAGWAYADWVAVSATTREALVYAGPWLAGWSAWTAGRYLGPRSLLCPSSAVRSGTPVVTSQLTLLSGAALTGYLLGLAPVLVSTMVRADAGSLNWLVLAGSAAVLMTFGALGYLIGCATPRAASGVIAVVIAFAAILLVDSWGPAVAPLRLSTPAAGQYENGVVAAFRAIFFAALALALAVSASRLVADRSTVRRASTFLGLLILVPPLLFGMVARSTAQPAVLKEAHPAARCTSVHSTPVCVHPAKAALLNPLADTVNRVMGSVSYQPAVPVTGVYDAALGRTGRTNAGRSGPTNPGRARLDGVGRRRPSWTPRRIPSVRAPRRLLRRPSLARPGPGSRRQRLHFLDRECGPLRPAPAQHRSVIVGDHRPAAAARTSSSPSPVPPLRAATRYLPTAKQRTAVSRGWTLYLAARGTRFLLILVLADLLAVYGSGVTVFEVKLVNTELPRFTPVWEILPVLLAILAPALLAPRLATWELLARARLRVRAATVASCAATGPGAIPWLAHLRLPEDARWWDISCNVTFFAAIALISTAALGTLAGPLIGLFAYLTTIAIQQAMPDIAAHLPVSGAQTNLTAHPIPAVALSGVAVVVWAMTLGQSRLARSLHRND